MDITHLYKHPPGTVEAEAALEMAHPRSNRYIRDLIAYMGENRKEMACSFVVSPQICLAEAGCECSATLEVRSISYEDLELEHVSIHVGAFTYSGWPIANDFKLENRKNQTS